MAASTPASRKSAAKKAAKTRKARSAGKKVAKTRKGRASAQRSAGKKAVVTRSAKAAGASSAKAAELDSRIAIVRGNLRTLVEQAASVTGASSEELMSQRIAEQEAKLELLKKQRDEL
jgi:hypothetical protein